MLTLLALLLVSPQASKPHDWPQFRGPGGLALADDAPIPTDLAPTKHMRWKTKVPSGHSSPCVVGERLYLTGAEGPVDHVLALDRRDGKLLWSQRFEGEPLREFSHPDAAGALATVACDGERVLAYFGNFGLVALDTAGKLLWQKRLPQPRHSFGVGSSPILMDGVVILSRDGAPEGAILVLDATDGSELSTINRFGFGESHGTPFLWRNAARDELVVGGNGTLSSYDLASGELIWNYKGTTAFPCTTPTADKETLYFAAWSTPNATGRSFWEAAFDRSLDLTDAETEDPALLFARLDTNGDGKILRAELPECRAKDAFGVLDEDANGSWEKEEFISMAPPDAAGKNLLVAVARGGEGELGASHVRWTWERGLPYVSSPLLYKDRLWLFQSGGLVSVLDAKTGEPLVDRERLSDRAEYYASPVGAAGHVLVGSAEGTLYVLSAAVSANASEAALTIEHTTTFDEGLFATPAVLDGVVYLRTATTQWAFALPAK